MPIKFRCPQCGRLLRTARRKVGTEIQCPQCGFSQIVPNEETAAAALALGGQTEGPAPVFEVPELVIENTPKPAQEAGSRDDADRPESSADSSPPPGTRRVPSGMVLFRRQTLYAQAVLFPVVALVAFAAGYLIGQGSASRELSGEREGGSERVLLEGRIVYDPGSHRLTADENAVVVVLPDGRFPKQPWSPFGVRPSDPPPPDSHRTVRGIRELGGAYLRADGSGEFSTVLPTGKYRILLISRHTARPPADFLDELDKTQIAQYFSAPAELLRDSKYRWMQKELKAGVDAPLAHSFGRDKVK